MIFLYIKCCSLNCMIIMFNKCTIFIFSSNLIVLSNIIEDKISIYYMYSLPK